MNKTKILTILGVCLAMGLTACGGAKSSEDAPKSSENPVSQSENPSSSEQDKSSSQQPTSSEAPAPQKDQTGHIWGADADVAADAEAGTVAYKRAVCTEEDKAVKYTVNQSVVTYASGSTRKDGTPEGYTKLSGKNQSWSFKIKTDKYLKGKVYLFGCMDGWSSNSGKKAFDYNGKPNIKVTINGKDLDIAALANVVYTDFLSGSASDYSDDGYGCLGDVVLNKGVNEFVYTRLESMNTLVKDVVFVGEEIDTEWGEAQTVAAAEGSIAYTKYASNLDADMIKVEWKAIDGTLSTGASIKEGTPVGFLKLSSNTQKVSFALNIAGNYDGQIYQRGAMDGYPGNASQTYFSQTKGAKYGNFEMIVNESKVYIGDKRGVTYADMLGTEVDASIVDTKDANNKYSYAKDALIGDCFLKDGANTASYERVDSYNLAISHFVFIGKKVANAHVNPAADAAFAGQDDDSHWQVAEGDAFKFNRGEHRLVADTDETDTESTCTVKGVKHYKCEVCGKKFTEELELKAHTWVSDPDLADTDVPSTCTTHGVAHVKCSVCGAKEAQELPLGAHTWGEAQTAIGDAVPHECTVCHAMCYELTRATPDKLKADVTWNVTGLPAGTYEVHLYACIKAGTNRSQSLMSGDVSRYQFRFDDGDYVNTGNKTYEQFGFGAGENAASCAWTDALCNVVAGDAAASFTIHWTDKGYSSFIVSVRLVKIA